MRLRHVALAQNARRATRAQPVGALPGTLSTRRRGRGIEVHDIRLWLDGDDVRHIDANATARTGHLHVRTFHDDPESAVLLFADFRPSMLFGTKRTFKSVAAAEALALAGWSMIASGRRVGLFAVGPDATTFVPHRNGERGMAAVIGGLVDAHAKALESAKMEDDSLDACLEMAAQHLAPGGALIIASGLDAPGPSFESFMTSWARRASLQVIVVSDAFEHERPRGWYPFATGSGRPEWGRFDVKTPAAKDERLMLLAKCGVSAVRLDVEHDPEIMIPELEALDVAWT
ncbi:MAG: DUF58 domain-containing protein [Beijerinckiaceae bacterium]|nr:MAG: DUF58 domain-containing protein [Beijerinckiaceae bacterium]